MSKELTFARALTSLTALMIPMLTIIAGTSIIGADLLFDTLPNSMTVEMRGTAAALLGIVVSMALSSISTNKNLLTKWHDRHEWIGFPLLLAICSFFMWIAEFKVLENWHTFTWDKLAIRIFFSAFIALLEYIFVYLFTKKIIESTTEIKLETKIQYQSAEIKQLKEDNLRLTESLKDFKATSTALTEIRKQLKCIHCGQESTTLSANRNHQSRCKKRPQTPKPTN